MSKNVIFLCSRLPGYNYNLVVGFADYYQESTAAFYSKLTLTPFWLNETEILLLFPT